MGPVEGFFSVWKKARETFGEGTPQTGEQFDHSATLRELETQLESTAPGDQWTGAAADAYGAVNTEHRRVIGELANLDQRLGAQVTKSAQIVTAGRNDLENLRHQVATIAARLPEGTAGDAMRYTLVSDGAGKLTDIVRRSNSDLNNVGAEIDRIDKEYRALGNQKFGGGLKETDTQNLLEDANEDKEDKEEQEDEEKSADEVGAEDSEAFQAGELTDEQRERLVENTTLSTEQQVALNNGTLSVPPEQMAYLQGFSRAFGDKKPAEIKAIMDKTGTDGRRVADAFQLASNPNITTGLPESDPPSISEPSGGGFHALPVGIQEVLQGPVLTPVGVSDPAFGEDGSLKLPEVTAPSRPVAGLNDLADIIQAGNRDLQAGTDLDRGLFDQSQRLLEQSNGWPVPGSNYEEDLPRWYHESVDPTLQNMFNAVNKDEMLIHEVITGSGAENFLNNVTQHQWQDDGLAAGGLFDWVGETAATDSTGRAAETAHALAGYVGDHSHQLLNLEGTDNLSLGEVNPELTRDWARAFSPYFDDMVGSNNGDSTGFFPPLDSPAGPSSEPSNTRNVMSVLLSDHPPLDQEVDPNAPPTASQIVGEKAQSHIETYFDRSADSLIDDEPGEEYSPMRAAGKLQAAMDLGAYDERYDATRDETEAKKQAHQLKTKTYEAIVAAAGQIPGAGPFTSVAGFAGDFIFGSEPGMPGVAPPETRDMFPWHAHMAERLVIQGVGNTDLLAGIVRDADGSFILPDPEVNEGTDWSTNYDDILSYLRSVDGVFDLSNHYWQSYSSAIMNATPPQEPEQ